MSSLNKLVAVLNWGILTRSKYVHVEKQVNNLLILKTFVRVGLLKAFIVKQQFIVVYYKYSSTSWNNIISKIQFISTSGRKFYKSRKGLYYFGKRVWGDYLISTSLGLYMYTELINTPQLSKISGKVILKIHYSGSGGKSGNVNRYLV